MSNVLSDDKKQQVIALGKLGWTLRRIEQATGVRRETASYLKAAGLAVRPSRGWGRRPADSKPANGVTTDSEGSKPAITEGVTTDFIRPFSPKLSPELPPPNLSSSACAPFAETIEQALSRGRNAMAIWQDLVTEYGFNGGYESVKRFVRKIRGRQKPQASGIIITAPGEEAQVDYGTGPLVPIRRLASTGGPGCL
jgi:hypothetical protein